MDKLQATKPGQSLEQLKQTNAHGPEYWSARDLQALLGYGQWRRFEEAIQRAITSCQSSGNDPEYHIANAGKMVGLGSGSEREEQIERVMGATVGMYGDLQEIAGKSLQEVDELEFPALEDAGRQDVKE